MRRFNYMTVVDSRLMKQASGNCLRVYAVVELVFEHVSSDSAMFWAACRMQPSAATLSLPSVKTWSQ
jgi:hypothetical protein